MKPAGPSRRRTILVLCCVAGAITLIAASSSMYAVTAIVTTPGGADIDLSVRYGLVQVVSQGVQATPTGRFSVHAFGYFRGSEGPLLHWAPLVERTASGLRLVFPLWIAALPLAGYAGALQLHERRRPPHACAGCGYDRSEDPAARCPECGRG